MTRKQKFVFELQEHVTALARLAAGLPARAAVG